MDTSRIDGVKALHDGTPRYARHDVAFALFRTVVVELPIMTFLAVAPNPKPFLSVPKSNEAACVDHPALQRPSSSHADLEGVLATLRGDALGAATAGPPFRTRLAPVIVYGESGVAVLRRQRGRALRAGGASTAGASLTAGAPRAP